MASAEWPCYQPRPGLEEEGWGTSEAQGSRPGHGDGSMLTQLGGGQAREQSLDSED